MGRVTAEQFEADVRAGDTIPVARVGDLGVAPDVVERAKRRDEAKADPVKALTERLDRLETDRVVDDIMGRPPTVVEQRIVPPKVENKVLLDGGSTRKGSLYAATDSPIASAVAGSPSVTQWRVWRDVDGVRSYLGTIAGHARPEVLIARFPGAMPLPGQVGHYILRALSPEGREVGTELPFNLDGANPDVQQARASLSGAASSSSGSGALEASLAALLERQARASEAALEEARKEAQRVAAALAAERRQLADERAAAERERAERARSEADSTIARIREEARIERDREADRRRQDREDLEQRHKEERAERDRRDAREREERAERERERERMLQAERERDREHQARLASLTAASSLENTVGKAGALLSTLGINPSELVTKLLGGGGDAAQPVIGEGTAAVIGGVVGKLVEQIGQIVQKQQEIQAAQINSQARPAPVFRQTPALTGPVASPAPATAPNPAATPTPTPEKPVTENAALKAIPVADQRKARLALRRLAELLPTVAENLWQAEVIQAVSQTPQIVPFVKAVGIEKACLEAGLSEENTRKIVAAVPPGVL